MKTIFLALSCFVLVQLNAQNEETANLPFHEIPEAPQLYKPGNVVARMIDGLGYRYYWATKDLRPEDLAYQPSEDARSCKETLQHIYGLSETIVNAPAGKPNVRRVDLSEMSFEELRAGTLKNLEKARTLCLDKTLKEMKDYKIVFQRGENQSEFPFWNMLNGPLADAIYHTGQIVVFRRSSGNPINPKVNVFIGKTGK